LHDWKIEEKIEEIEDNKGLNDKKAYEDQFIVLCKFYLWN